MTYLPRPIYLSDDDMAKYILAIPTTAWTWKPVGITWHNTGVPSLKEWDAYSDPVKRAWGDNLDHYYKYNERWHAGPHACGTPDFGIVLGDFRANGVHASCFNADHFGFETVGDFRHGGDDPSNGRGLLSMRSSANIIAATCKLLGWEPAKVVNFHRMCTQDGHPCPGDLVPDAWAIGLVEARLKVLNGAAPSPTPVVSPVALAARRLEAAVSSFQQAAGMYVDGDPGPATRAAYLKALSP
jgi:hypothetical protein